MLLHLSLGKMGLLESATQSAQKVRNEYLAALSSKLNLDLPVISFALCINDAHRLQAHNSHLVSYPCGCFRCKSLATSLPALHALSNAYKAKASCSSGSNGNCSTAVALGFQLLPCACIGHKNPKPQNHEVAT